MAMNKEVLRTIKFTLFSISAGIIELLTEELLTRVLGIRPAWIGYLTGLVLSVLWNFTFNRRYTFQSAANLPRCMLLVALYYVVFTPLSTLAQAWMTDTLHWDATIGTVLCMLVNFTTEFLYQKLVVYRGTLDTNDVAAKSKK